MPCKHSRRLTRPKRRTNPVKTRQTILRALGYRNYRVYLASPLWKSIRQKVFQLRGRKCICCGRPANQVHHLSYDEGTLSGAVLTSLVPIARTCHKLIHLGGVSLCRANAKLLARVNWFRTHPVNQ